MNDQINIQIAIQNLNNQINRAFKNFRDWTLSDDDWFNPSWLIESCFFQLLAIAEMLSLADYRKMIYEEYITAKNSKNGFNVHGKNSDGEPYSIVLSKVNQFFSVFENLLPNSDNTVISKDLFQIIRDIHYVITNKSVFHKLPENENDVHIRIEAVLKCVFPDLKNKPVLTKQIKNFIPDTGIPSLHTLIEYKYLSRKVDVGSIADQLLADTLGYTSKEWTRFLFVIYETNRFRTEKDWNLFLRESNIPSNISVVVLGGEPANKKILRKRKNIT